MSLLPHADFAHLLSTPSPVVFRKLKLALVDQVPGLTTSWWRRVRDATYDGSVDRLLILKAEAEHRFVNADRAVQHATIDLLFGILYVLATSQGKS